MSVLPEGGASVVKIVTDYNVAGRVAQFGRGVMEDVSKRLVGQMADCIKANVEAAEPSAPSTPSDQSASAGPAATGNGPAPAASGSQAGPPTQVATAKPVNALGLLFSVLFARLRELFGGPGS
jgi:hypothetical protein